MPDVLFLDANILYSAAHGPTTILRRLWRIPNVELVTSVYARDEAWRNLNPDQRTALQELLDRVRVVNNPVFQSVPLPVDVVLPAKDRPILLAAIASGATHLLTGDSRHFGPYFGQMIEGVMILSPADYP